MGFESGKSHNGQLALLFWVLLLDVEVHAALFMHTVTGLPKRLYFLMRNENHFNRLERAIRAAFKWETPDGCLDDLPFYKLTRDDCQ